LLATPESPDYDARMPTVTTTDAKTKSTDVLGLPLAETAGVSIVVVGGPDSGTQCNLVSGDVIVGKSRRCGLHLCDEAVSKQHLRIQVVAGGIRATDLESTNGTFYLQTKLDTAVLCHGAVLTVGRTKLALLSLQPPAGPEFSPCERYGAVLGTTPAMRRLVAMLERIEGCAEKVLITGETGVGKELVAREIHAHSTRAKGPFVALNCGAIPAGLVEAELFGHIKGAFTGAHEARPGVFERAAGGTLFLDEIGELPLVSQSALLRVLESGEVLRVGGTEVLNADARVIAATNRDLATQVTAGRFRQDLLFRLEVLSVHVPPLRDHREDIPLLVQEFLRAAGHEDAGLSSDTMELFTCAYDWPGNVRELRNALARVLVLGTMPEKIEKVVGARAAGPPPGEEETFAAAKQRLLDAFERDYLSRHLARANQNLAQAARLAGLDRSYFKRLLRRHGLLPRRG